MGDINQGVKVKIDKKALDTSLAQFRAFLKEIQDGTKNPYEIKINMEKLDSALKTMKDMQKVAKKLGETKLFKDMDKAIKSAKQFEQSTTKTSSQYKKTLESMNKRWDIEKRIKKEQNERIAITKEEAEILKKARSNAQRQQTINFNKLNKDDQAKVTEQENKIKQSIYNADRKIMENRIKMHMQALRFNAELDDDNLKKQQAEEKFVQDELARVNREEQAKLASANKIYEDRMKKEARAQETWDKVVNQQKIKKDTNAQNIAFTNAKTQLAEMQQLEIKLVTAKKDTTEEINKQLKGTKELAGLKQKYQQNANSVSYEQGVKLLELELKLIRKVALAKAEQLGKKNGGISPETKDAYNQEKSYRKVIKLQSKIFELNKDNLNASKEEKKVNDVRIERLDRELKKQKLRLDTEKKYIALSNQKDLNKKLSNVKTGKINELKEQKSLYKDAENIVTRIYKAEKDLTGTVSAEKTRQLKEQKQLAEGELVTARKKLNINQRINLNALIEQQKKNVQNAENLTKEQRLVKSQNDAYKTSMNSLKEMYKYKKQMVKASEEEKSVLKDLMTEEKTRFDTNKGNVNLEQRNELNRQNLKLKRELVAYEFKHHNSIKRTNSGLGSMVKRYASMYISVYALIRELREGFSFINEMDKELTQIQMVTGKSKENIHSLGMEYNQLAVDLRKTTKELTHSAEALYRQGLETDQVNERLRVFSKTASVLGSDAQIITEQMTAGINSLQIGAEELADKVVKVGSVAGTNGNEILTAIQKVGSTANLAGISVDKLISYIATISEVTREPAESIGNSLKTIFAKFQQVNSVTGDANEDFGKVRQAITEVGVAFEDTSGQIRPVSDILDDLSVKWETLDGNTQRAITTTLGVRQFNRFASLMENYARSTNLATESLSASGTVHKQYQVYLESTEAKINELKTAQEQLWMNALSSGQVQSLVSGLTTIVKNLDYVINKAKAFGVMLGVLAFAFIAVKKEMMIAKAIQMFATEMFIAIRLGMGLSGVLQVVTTNFKLLGKALLGMTFKSPLFIIAGISIALMGWINKQRKAREETEKQRKALIELTDTLREQKAEIKDLNRLLADKKKIEQTKEIERSIEQKEELIRVEKELAKALPNTTTSYDSQNEALAENTALIEERIEAKKKDAIQDALAVVDTVDLDEEYNKARKYYSKMTALENIKKAKTEDERKQLTKEFIEQNGGYHKGFQKEFDGYGVYDWYMGKEGANEEDALKELTGLLTDVTEDYREVEDVLVANQEASVFLNDEMGITDRLLKTFSTKEGKAVGIMFVQNAKAVEDGTDKVEKYATEYERLSKVYSDSQSRFKESVSSYENLKDYQQEMKDNGRLSVESVQEIIKSGGELKTALGGTTDELQQKIETMIIETEADAKDAYARMLLSDGDFYSEKIANNVGFYNEYVGNNADLVNELSDAYGTDFTNFTEIAKAKETIDSALRTTIGDNWKEMYGSQEEALKSQIGIIKGGLYSELEDNGYAMDERTIGKLRIIKELEEQLGAVEKLNKAISEGVQTEFHTPELKDQDGNKTNTVYKETLDLSNKYMANLDTINDVLENQDNILEGIQNKIELLNELETEESRKEAIKETTKLYAEQSKKLNMLKDASENYSTQQGEISKDFKSNWSELSDKDLSKWSKSDFQGFLEDKFPDMETKDKGVADKFKEDKNKFEELVESWFAFKEAMTQNSMDITSTENDMISTLKDGYENYFEATEEQFNNHTENLERLRNEHDMLNQDGDFEERLDYIYQMQNEAENYITSIENSKSKLVDKMDVLDDSTTEWQLINEEVQEYNDLLYDAKGELKDTLEMEKALNQEEMDKASTLKDSIISALKDKYSDLKEAHEKAIIASHEDEIEDKKQEIQDLRDEIALLQDDTKEREESLMKLKKQRELWAKDGSAYAKGKVLELDKKIAKEQKNLDIKKLQNALKTKEQELKAEEDKQKKEIQTNKDKYDKLLEEDELHAEAYNLLMKANTTKTQEEIIELIKTYDNRFKETGNFLGKALSEGILEEIKKTVQEGMDSITALEDKANKVKESVDNKTEPVDNIDPPNFDESPNGEINLPPSDGSGGSASEIESATIPWDGVYYRKGSRGSGVERVQKNLNSEGFSLDVDGIFGNATRKAVREFQKSKGLSVDGIVGNNTWEELVRFNTGGYTGNWGGTGKLALLDEKERVLDQHQTKAFDHLIYNLLPNFQNNSMLQGIINAVKPSNTFNAPVVQNDINITNNTPFDVDNNMDNLNRAIKQELNNTGYRLNLIG